MADDPKPVIPEVMTDSQNEQDMRRREGVQYYESIRKLESSRFPWYLRLANLLIAAVISVFGSVLILCALLFTVIAGLALFQNQKLNKSMFNVWNLFFKLLVFFFGMLVAVFYPPLGYGLIVLYFMLRHEKLDATFFGRLRP